MDPRSLESQTDRSNVIEVATYASAGALVLFFIARQVMKAVVFRKVAVDDLFILLATVSTSLCWHITSNVCRLLQLACQSLR